MKCTDLALYLCHDSKIKLYESYGKNGQFEILNDLIEYSCFVLKKTLNIRNLSVEPLMNCDVNKYSSCLIIPGVFKSGQAYVMCFLKTQKEFLNVDLKYAEKIMDSMKNINFLTLGGKSRINLTDFRQECNLLQKFSIPSYLEFYDFYTFFSEIKEKLIDIVELNSCSIYVADQITDELWTQNSSSSSSLFFPYSANTLIGYTYMHNQIIILPNTSNYELSDCDAFKDKFVLSLPIRSNKFKNPVLGVIICIKKSKAFSDNDSWMLEKYSESIANALENIYISNLSSINLNTPVFSNNASPSNSPRSLFRAINMRNSDITKIDLKKESINLGIFINELLDFMTKSLKEFPKIEKYFKIVKDLQEPNVFISKLHKALDCQRSELYFVADYNYRISKLGQSKRIESNELAKYCILKKRYAYVSRDKIYPDDEGLSLICKDFFKTENEKSIMMIPVMNSNSSIIGVLVLHNFLKDISESSIDSLKCLGAIVGALYSQKEPKIWENLTEKNRSQYVLQQWSKTIIEVSKSCISNMISCKNSICALKNEHDLDKVLKIGMAILSASTISSKSSLKIFKNNKLIKITCQEILVKDFSHNKLKKFKTNSSQKSYSRIFQSSQSAYYFPISSKTIFGYLKISTLKSMLKETSKKFATINQTQIFLLQDLCTFLPGFFQEYPSVSLDSRSKLSNFFQIIAFKYSPSNLYLAVQTAIRSLVNSERAIVYIYEDGKFSIPEQGADMEIPSNFSISEDQFLLNEVMASNSSINLENAYEDTRFDTQLDKITAYKTLSLLCVGLNYAGQKIGCIEAINKFTGTFTHNDQELLENFSEIVSVMLQIINTLQKNLEDHFQLLAISNSMQNYTLVFSDSGKIVYCNKPTEGIFGKTIEEVKDLMYNEWMRPNEGLIDDMMSVFNGENNGVRKVSQKIRKSENDSVFTTVNYRISLLDHFSHEYFSAVLLSIDDASAIESLYNEFKTVQENVREFVSPLRLETKLQKSLKALRLIEKGIDNAEIKESLSQIINSLQGGHLKKPTLLINGSDNDMAKITSILDMPMDFSLQKNISMLDGLDEMIVLDSRISLEDLRNWELNAFQIEDQFEYIYCMLNDFDLIRHYKIKNTTLFNFMTKIKDKSNFWNNPFHNFRHCFNVMHGVYMLLASTTAGSYFTSLQIFGLLIASICHDVDHRGRTNMFEVFSKSELANRYHDKSVLERHHAAVTFYTLHEEGCNILEALNRETYMLIRKTIISAILATDMAKHLRILDEMNTRFKQLGDKKMGSLENDADKLGQFFVHCGDLWHPCKPYSIYEVWSILVCQEFSDQYQEEMKLGVPLTSFMKDLDKPKVYYGNEIGFLTYVVKPLWECCQIFLSPDIDKLVENINHNIEIMKKKQAEWKEAEE